MDLIRIYMELLKTQVSSVKLERVRSEVGTGPSTGQAHPFGTPLTTYVYDALQQHTTGPQGPPDIYFNSFLTVPTVSLKPPLGRRSHAPCRGPVGP